LLPINTGGELEIEGGNFGTDIDEKQRFLEGEKEKKRKEEIIEMGH
jgi:hypothetical protein